MTAPQYSGALLLQPPIGCCSDTCCPSFVKLASTQRGEHEAKTRMILVTGWAGFIGSNFVLDWLGRGGEPVVNLNKLTYAGNPENLATLKDDARHVFVRGDIGDGGWSQACSTHISRAPSSTYLPTRFTARLSLRRQLSRRRVYISRTVPILRARRPATTLFVPITIPTGCRC